MDTPIRVGIYTRISEDKDGNQTATVRQLQDAREFSARRDWEVVDVFEDVDLSAFKSKVRRPEFERMVAMLRSGEIEGVVVWKLDRLSRQQRDFATVMEACEPHHGFVASVTEPINTHEPHGQFVAELLVAQARMESANTSARSKRKAQESREKGLPPTNGRRCLGYTKDYSRIIEEEAAIIRDVRDRIFAGETHWSICQSLESRDVKTSWGNSFAPNSLKRTMLCATIAGEREHEGRRYPGNWEPIISPEDSKRLGILLNKKAGQPRKAPARRYLLTGYARCGRCGWLLKGHAKGQEVGRYVCVRIPGTTRCGSLSARAEPLEDVVKKMLIAAVDEGAVRGAMNSTSEISDGLLEAVQRDEQALESLSKDFYVENLITRDEFLAARSELMRRLETNRSRLVQRTKRSVLTEFAGEGDLLRTAWEQGTLEWRRSIVAALLEHVEVLPGQPGRLPFDPSRVRPIWKL